MTQDQGESTPTPIWKWLLLVLITVFVLIVFRNHLFSANGPPTAPLYWRLFDARQVYPWFLLAAIPGLLGQYAWEHRKKIVAIALITLTALCMRFAVSVSGPGEGLYLARWELQRVWISGYYADAEELDVHLEQHQFTLPDFLRNFPSYMPTLRTHARIRPPGLTLMNYAIIRLCDSDRELAMNLIIILYATLSSAAIPAAYHMMRLLRFSANQSFAGATLLAFAPGVSLNFPTVDTWYPLVTCLLITLWLLSLLRQKTRYAIGFGFLLSLTLFATYNFLVLGIFLLGLMIFRIYEQPTAIRRIIALALLAFAIIPLFFLALYLSIGFKPIETFNTALRLEQAFRISWHRDQIIPYGWDLYGFAMSAGFLPVILLIMGLTKRDSDPQHRHRLAIVYLALAQILILTFTKLLMFESIRVWIFLLPLLLLGAALELARWKPIPRVITLTCLALIGACYFQNMRMW